MVSRNGLAREAVHDGSGDFIRRAFRLIARLRASVVASIGNAARFSFLSRHLRAVCSGCPHPCQQNLWTTRVAAIRATARGAARTLRAAPSNSIASNTCRCLAQDTHRLLNRNCGQPRSVSRAPKAVFELSVLECMRSNPNRVNDLCRSCSGCSQACPQKLWTSMRVSASRRVTVQPADAPSRARHTFRVGSMTCDVRAQDTHSLTHEKC